MTSAIPDRLLPLLRLAVGAAVAAAGAFAASSAHAQRPAARTGEDAALERSPEVETLLQRAQDGSSRGDWKLAIDSLQRVIDEPKGVLLERDDGMLESARLHALRKLLSLPPEGRAAYRVLYDGRAERLLPEARAGHLPEKLREVVDLYFLTSKGDDAAYLLASWLLDDGDFDAAWRALDLLREFHADSDLPPAAVQSLRVVAAAGAVGTAAAESELTGSAEAIPPDRAEELHSLVRAVAADAASPAAASASGRPPDWPVLGGASGTGAMPMVTPTLVPDLPWRRPMPGAEPDDWLAFLQEVEENEVPPVLYPVMNNGRLFVRSLERCAAIDLDTFDLLWVSAAEVETLSQRQIGQVRWIGGASVQAYRQFSRHEQIAHDEIIGGLSAWGDLVLSVERGTGLLYDADGVAVFAPGGGRQRLAIRNQPGAELRSSAPCRLKALDADTGALRWSIGGGSDSANPLNQADFLAAPVAGGGRLWMPASANGDIQLLAIDPADGTVERTIMLCTPAGGGVPINQGLWPTVRGGVLFVPTGQGLLFAIDVYAAEPLWAVRYERDQRTWQPGPVEAQHWLSTPPLVEGAALILAPTDADELLAFDRFTGKRLWSAPREDMRYAIAASQGNVWLGGRRIVCLDAADGKKKWEFPACSPTGKAILSGSVLYVPVTQGLLALDAATGEELRLDPLPADHLPLGNLLVTPDGLVSVDGYEVRKYPDLEHAYARVKRQNEAHPPVAVDAIRRAWLEMVRGAPDAALEALEPVIIPAGPDGGRLHNQVGKLRVQARVALSMREGVSPEQALALLDDAAKIAVAGEDILQVALVRAERLVELGRKHEAFAALWSLGDLPALDREVVCSNQTTRPIWGILASRVREATRDLQGGQRESVLRDTRASIDPLLRELHGTGDAAAARRALRTKADLGAPGGCDQQVLLELGQVEAADGAFELAEQDFQETFRLAPLHPVAAEAARRLAAMYLDPSQDLVVSAAGWLARAADGRPADVQPPAGTPQLPLDPARLEERRGEMLPVPFQVIDEVEWPGVGAEDRVRMVRIVGPRPEALAERVLLVTDGDGLRCLRAQDGELLWETELRLPSAGRYTQLLEGSGPTDTLDDEAVASGQTLLLTSHDALHAVGMVTGRRLWALPMRRPWTAAAEPHSARLVDAAEGRAVFVPEAGRITLVRVGDGSTIWSRRTSITRVDRVVLADGAVVVVDAAPQRMALYDLEQGRLIAEIGFKQPTSADPPLGPLFVRDVVIVPDGMGVAGYDTRTGESRWRLPVLEGPTGMFAVDADRFVVGAVSGSVRIVETASGNVTFSKSSLSLLQVSILSGTLADDVLVLAGISTTSPRQLAIIGLNTESGEMVWRRQDLMALPEQWYFELIKGAFPLELRVFVKDAPAAGQSGNSRASSAMALGWIDARRGTDLGPPLRVPSGGNRLGHVAVSFARLFVQTVTGLDVFQTEPVVGEHSDAQ